MISTDFVFSFYSSTILFLLSTSSYVFSIKAYTNIPFFFSLRKLCFFKALPNLFIVPSEILIFAFSASFVAICDAFRNVSPPPTTPVECNGSTFDVRIQTKVNFS
jgi:hypothetical protein